MREGRREEGGRRGKEEVPVVERFEVELLGDHTEDLLRDLRVLQDEQ